VIGNGLAVTLDRMLAAMELRGTTFSGCGARGRRGRELPQHSRQPQTGSPGSHAGGDRRRSVDRCLQVALDVKVVIEIRLGQPQLCAGQEHAAQRTGVPQHERRAGRRALFTLRPAAAIPQLHGDSGHAAQKLIQHSPANGCCIVIHGPSGSCGPSRIDGYARQCRLDSCNTTTRSSDAPVMSTDGFRPPWQVAFQAGRWYAYTPREYQSAQPPGQRRKA